MNDVVRVATAPPPLPAARSGVSVLWLSVAAALLLVGTVVLYRNDPTTSRFYLPCPFHALTGLYCPGCGTTRALHQLLHGHLAAAFDYNPLAVVALPFVILGLARELWRSGHVAPPPRRTTFLPAWWVWVLLVVVVAFWIARNLPWRPVRWMAP